MPLVSVVIPTFNHAAFVLEALDSVFAQTFSDHEIIVVNDGSTDNTADLLRPFVAAGRIRYVEQANAGQAAARNRGIVLTSGKYIALLDDDDRWPADKLAWQVQTLEAQSDAVLAYGYARILGGKHPRDVARENRPTGDVRDRFLLKNWIISPGQTLIRKSALDATGGFDQAIWGADDWDLYIRLAHRGAFVFADRSALEYRTHAGNASKDLPRLYRNCRDVQRKHAKLYSPALWQEARAELSRWIGELLVEAAHHAQAAGDLATARRHWLWAARVRPALWRQSDARRQIIRAILPRWLFAARRSSASAA